MAKKTLNPLKVLASTSLFIPGLTFECETQICAFSCFAKVNLSRERKRCNRCELDLPSRRKSLQINSISFLNLSWKDQYSGATDRLNKFFKVFFSLKVVAKADSLNDQHLCKGSSDLTQQLVQSKSCEDHRCFKWPVTDFDGSNVWMLFSLCLQQLTVWLQIGSS